MRYNAAADSFYIMKLCSRLFVQKTTDLGILIPILRKLGRRRTLVGRWKARAEFLLSVIELLFYLLRLRRYKAKCVKTRCPQVWVGHLEPKFQGEGVVPGEIFF